MSRHFAHTTILASAGITVKGVTPEVTTCPFCGRDSFSILPDPIYIGPKWFHCAACRWSGDAVEAYKKLTNSEDLETAIEKAIVDGVCHIGRAEATPASINGYLKYYPDRRGKLNTMWGLFQAGMSYNPHPDVVHLLQRYTLWAGAGSAFQKRIQQILGAAVKYDIKKAFEQYYVKTTNELPSSFISTGFRTCLIIPYYDTPGRICAFQFLGDGKKEEFLKTLGQPGSDNVEGGIAMLDLLDAYEKYVIAVDDPHLALQLHRRRFIEFDQPIKLVAYNRQTKAAWRSVNADKVVFWNNKISVKLFEQARRVANGYISTKHWYHTISGSLSKSSQLPQSLLISEVEKSARPWPEVFVQWVTEPDRTETEAIYAFEQLSFTPSEKDLIILAASEIERFKLETLMGAHHRPRTVSVNGLNIMEKGGQWIVAQLKSEIPITEATIHIEEEIVYPKQGTSSLAGYIVHCGQRVQFTSPTKLMQLNPAAWLTEVAHKAGLGTPRVDRRFARHLIDIAQAFANPRVKVISEQADPVDQCIGGFSRFNIIKGGSADQGGRFPARAL